ncbi:SAM-dependent methyltransferase [Mycobacterium simiae]|uniref:S-adenosyl-L-methionine-dependent methyltransferase n=1 Tax=Mycobacterium simiae TaxID=1784 RepID=A0A5B1BSG6_MYCSI|nr:SAM-dependent methyltransferase [Mycobacterium simiae]
MQAPKANDLRRTGRRLDHKASLTAQINAAQRAAETLQPPGRRLLDDPHARHFVRHPFLRAVLAHRVAAGLARRVFDGLWGGLHAHIVLRLRYTDDICAAAISAGIDQIVLLGAGFDTMSLRTASQPVTIFEVDAPTTQAAKRPITEQLLPIGCNSTTIWVPVDFEQGELCDQLLKSGFDPHRRSVIIWVGVTMYLTGGAIEQTVADLAELCAPGSRLVLDYIDGRVVTATTPWRSARRVTRVVARRGEPYRSGFTATELSELLGTHGFECGEHLTVPTLLRRYDPAHASRLADDDWLAIAAAQRI